MCRKVSIILLFVLAIMAGHLTSFFSLQSVCAEQPYLIAATKRFVRFHKKELEAKIKLLAIEQEKSSQELAELKEELMVVKRELGEVKQELARAKKTFATYKKQVNQVLIDMKKVLDKSSGSAN